jgi:hypothetical protein
MTNPRFIRVSKALPAVAIATSVLFAGSALAAKPTSKKVKPQPTYDVTQPAVGDEMVLIEGQVLEIVSYFPVDNGTDQPVSTAPVMYRFMISRPTIDGTPARSAYLTACTGTDATCQEYGFSAVSTDGISLGSQINAYGTITAINVKQYYSTYYLDATSDISLGD